MAHYHVSFFKNLQVKEMPNTGEDREIIHIQAPIIHKVFTAYISIL
jgi:hypothetical protein